MKRIIILIFNAAMTAAVFSQRIPEGYILQYQQDFSGKNPINDFRSDSFQPWKIGSGNGNKYLEFSHSIDSTEYSHLNICLVKDYIFGDFIIEADLMNPVATDGSDFWFLFGIKDSLKYYCVDVSSTDNQQSKGLFVVEDDRPLKIPCIRYGNIRWDQGKWHKVRIERDIVDTSVRIFFDDMNRPFLETKDRTFIMGYIGFGSGAGKWRIDNIKIWSQTSIPEPAGFLREKL
ncbi:MAG: hypothetical protein JW723_06670 [Bacteroidales bacterium]|nr:hypothetical protein [Bacteroidales bacterium]